MNRPRWVLLLIGPLLIWRGVIWIQQGSGQLSDSSRSGHHVWVYVGIVTILIGAYVTVYVARKTRSP